MRLAGSLDSLLQDIRYAARQLRNAPLFTAVATITLAIGIGANSAVFSVMNAVVLRYLPVGNPERLVLLHYTDQPANSGQTGYDETSLPENVFEAMRQQTNVFSDVVAFVPLGINKVPVRYGEQPEEAAADEVSGNFFSGLRVPLARGNGFTFDDEKQHAPLAVLSYGYWTRRFARNPSVLGHTIYIKGFPFVITGVAAPEFNGVEREKATDIWVPFQTNPALKPWGDSPQDRSEFYGTPNWFFLMEIARLRPGITLERAQAQLNPVYQQTVYSALGQPTGKEKDRPSALRLTFARGIEGQDVKPLAILMAMVALVLLIACGNVAMLLVARNAAREREFSLRMALGAGRGSIFRQLLTESLLLVMLGGVLGWFFAQVATSALATWSSIEISLAPDKRVLLFSLALCAIAALVFGLAPLRNAIKTSATLALKTSATASGSSRARTRTGQAVVALQVSLCLVLLVGAGLLVGTLRSLEHADLGFNVNGLVVFGTTPPLTVAMGTPSTRTESNAEAIRFYQKLLDRLRPMPGVESATLMENRLGSGWSSNTGIKVDGAVPGGKAFAPVRWNAVGPDFFHVLQAPIVLGRDFTDADTSSSSNVIIVNQTFAKRYLEGKSPLGHTVQLSGGSNSPQFTIVGVVADSRYTATREGPRPMAYGPYTQMRSVGTMHLEVRTRTAPDAVLTQARNVLREFGPDVPMLQPMTQTEQFAQSFSSERLFARLSLFFGLFAVLLVATGLYGTLAYRVSRRTAEIGVRIAVGAKPHQVLWMVLRDGLLVSAIGAAIGIPAAIAGSRLLKTMLFGVSQNDPRVFVIAVASVVAIAVAAGVIPARRASSVDPIIALRSE